MTEPRTAAGRAQHAAYHMTIDGTTECADSEVCGSRLFILAIEAEARTAALDEARAAVEGLDRWTCGYDLSEPDAEGRDVDRDEVLAAIDALREKP